MNQPITLYYAYDPMCSFCWGFKPEWRKLMQALPDSIQVSYLVGGLAPDSEAPMPEDMQSMLQNTWRRIQTLIPGTEFNFDFWRNNTPRRSTYPACRACLVAREESVEAETKMYEAIQQAYYLDAKNPSDVSTLVGIASNIGLAPNDFIDALQSPRIEQALMAEISFCRAQGLDSFPSLALSVGDETHPIKIDYNDHKPMLDRVLRYAQL